MIKISATLIVVMSVLALTWIAVSLLPSMQVGHCYRITGQYRGALEFQEIPCPAVGQGVREP